MSRRLPLVSFHPVRALLPIVYMAGLFWLSSVPGRQLARWGLTGDLWHVPLFGGLALATLWAVVAPKPRRLAITGVLCVLFGATDEWHQKYVPGRVPSLFDLGCDAVGVALGLAAGVALGGLRRRLVFGTGGDAA